MISSTHHRGNRQKCVTRTGIITPAPGTGPGASPAARDNRCTIAIAETMAKGAGGGRDLPLPQQIR
jgi:hypothetical protein